MTDVSQTTCGFFCVDDSRRLARRRVPRLVFDFVDGAAGQECAAQLNYEAFSTVKLQPRVLRRVDKRSIAKTFLGFDFGMPFGISPMGMCNLSWPRADPMFAKVASDRQIPLCVSSAASTLLEDMFVMSGNLAWFQLYVGESYEAAFAMVERAKNVGYEVLLLTVDVPQVAKRLRDQHNGFRVPFKLGPKQFLDFALHPRWSIETLMNGVPTAVNYETANDGRGFVRNESRALVDMNFLRQLRELWRGKLVVKGVLHEEDARLVKAAGVDAIYVSNHGGRQLDSAPPAIQILPKIREAVGSNFPLVFDSGIRSGEDVIKALALGADFVMLGRPFMYAVAADGARGLQTLVDILGEEIDVALAQIGFRNIEDVDASAVLWRTTVRTVGQPLTKDRVSFW